MHSNDLAYLAGVVDSDGTIGVKRSTYAVRVTKDSAQPTYSERVSVRQVEPHAVTLAAELFGGSRYITKPSVPGGRPLETWVVTDQKAATFLRAVLPYLRIKKPQAQNALALREVKDASKLARVRRGRGVMGSLARTEKHGQQMETHYLRAKELNRVGQRGE